MTVSSDLVTAFSATLSFSLDGFQQEALEHLVHEKGIVVCAPTSSGKTLVAEFAIWRALQQEVRGPTVIYTSPLKALSNQKYRDLCAIYGEDRIGLVTGEHAINDDAPILVMTTEILRNITYEDPQRLETVTEVILDEIHFLDDVARGTVWEELIIELPSHIRLIGLSATLSNIHELVDWMRSLRGEIAIVESTTRPVPMTLWLATDGSLYSLFTNDHGVNPSLIAHLERTKSRTDPYRRRPSHLTTLVSLLTALHRQQMTPAIYFIFSRKGCREALMACGVQHVNLTNDAEKERVDAAITATIERLPSEEQHVFTSTLDLDLLRKGVAMHHAGMLPSAKECVEHLFQQGLIKVVFATETLSLGLNMPARSCVISSFTKFTGEGFSSLTSTEVTQLLGRAGRRGIDTLGHGIIIKEPSIELDEILEAAVGTDMEIISKFTPTYSMVLNLLRRYDYERAIDLLERSFGHYQAVNRANNWDTTRIRITERLELLDSRVFQHPHRHCTEKTITSFLHHEQLLRRLLDDRRTANRRIGRGRRNRSALQQSQAAEMRRRMNNAKGELAKSPCSHCPYFQAHRDAINERRELRDRLKHEEEDLRREQGRFHREFDALRATLHALHFLENDTLTPLGETAAGLFGDRAILIAMMLATPHFEELTAAEFATILALLVGEDRLSSEPRGVPQLPSPALDHRATTIVHLLQRITRAEFSAELDTQRPLALEYVQSVYRWATGTPIDDISLPEGSDVGDLIRVVKNCYAMARQIEHVTRGTPMSHLATSTRQALERDVIMRI